MYPARCAIGVVVFVHGGGFCCGDKANDIGRAVPFFNDRGWTVVSVDYRLNVRYPAFDDDVAAAVRWVRERGLGRRIALVGHSTGASMVAEIGTTPRLLAATGGLSCVVALDGGGFDIAGAMRTVGPRGRDVYTKAYGPTPADWNAASAITYATPGHQIPPFLLVGRSGGSALMQSQQQRFADALRTAGARVQRVVADGYTHQQTITKIGDGAVGGAVARFLRTCPQDGE